MTKMFLQGADPVKDWGYSQCPASVRAVGNFMGSTLGKPLQQHQPSIFSGIDWCLLLSERLTYSSDVMEVVFSRYCHD